MKATRNISLDILRIIACLGVIMIHTSGSPIIHDLVQPGTVWFSECLILNALSRFAVPVFAMLTGFFMLEPTKKISIRLLLSKYVLRIIVALIVWSLFYAITLHKPLYPFGKQEGHFWYLEMLIGLYLGIPIFRLITNNNNALRYFCWVWLIYMVYRFAGKFVSMPFALGDVIFVEYAGYCLWGYYLRTMTNKNTAFTIIVIMGALTTILAALISQNSNTVFFSYTSPNIIAYSLGIFYLFSHYKTTIKIESRGAKILMNCSQCTFGIYLVHIWILIQIFTRVHRFIPAPIPLCLTCLFLTFFSGWVITLLVKKIPIINKYIV